MTETVRIAVWSGPRNISTAMMRAWENRADTAVMDEPFYGAFLATSGRPDPMRKAILAAEETDWRAAADLCATVDLAPIVYQKHMCSHMLPEAPLDWCRAARHAFLIRPPAEVAVSFARGYPDLVAADLGFHRQAELFETVAEMTGSRPPVVTARSVQDAPERTLRALCSALDVPFDGAMLAWPARAAGLRRCLGGSLVCCRPPIDRVSAVAAIHPARP